MSNYKVTEKDLIKDLEGFPIEVVEKMLEKQKLQKGCTDITVLQNIICGGFQWDITSEGFEFWEGIILRKDFSLFFTKYPKKAECVYIYQNGTKKGSDIINTLISRGGNNKDKLWGNSPKVYYYIQPITKEIKCVTYDDDIVHWLKTFYTEIDVESSIKEYTMQEIADKLGINVNELRIKK